MVYGICREHYSEEDFTRFKDDLDLVDLTELDPVKAQEELNRRAMQD
jgi:hypothetical protein